MRRQLTSTFRARLSKERGVALILTLAIIALVTLLLIAFVTSMRVENAASKSFNDLIKAREIALGAVDQAVATIRQATAERTEAPVVSTYVTFPGVIWTNFDGVFGPVYLYSAPLSADTTNLNAGFWITGQNPVEFPNEANSQINVGWLYVAEDGTVGPSVAGHGALVGRFAYWADDEASKINLNTAGQPPLPPTPDYGTSISTDVDLSVLLPGLNTLTAAITARQAAPAFTPATPGYTTIEEVKLADPTVNADSDFATNRFYLTTYSNDANYPNYTDDLDVFGRQRLIVSNLQNPGDIDGSGGANSALLRLSDPALNQVYSSSGAFDTKYNTVPNPNGLKQIIANIYAYQTNPAVTFPPDGGGTPPIYLGLAKTPYINEVQVRYDVAVNALVPTSVDVTRTISVELFYMYDGTYTVGATETIRLNNLPIVGDLPTSKIITPTGSIGPGGYAVFTVSDSLTTPLTAVTTIPAQTTPPTQVEYFRKYPPLIFISRHLDYSEMLLPAVTLNPITTPVYQGAEANDPAVNDTDNQWTKYPTVAVPIGTLGGGVGAQNSTYPAGNDVSKGVIMRGGPMQSVGELGYIHRPEPWKHLILQPQSAAEKALNQIPDWAMLDLFTVATPPTAGRININSFINPGFPIDTVRRLVPLNALLNSASGMIAPTTVPVLAQQIYDDITRSVGIDTYGMRNGRDGIFDSIGEICEAAGVADNAGKLEADREAAVRRIANLITVRSSTFTIWVMAQSIKQPPGSTFGTFTPGTDLIMGEVRAQAVVERYENPLGSAPKFRTRYFRYLYN